MSLPSFLHSEPLAFYPPALHGWLEQRREAVLRMGAGPDQGMDWLDNFYNQRRPLEVKEGIATIHVHDALAGNLTKIDKKTGMTDYADLTAELEQALADPHVRGILLDINSPGGSAVGVPEVGQAVAEARAQKPIVSHIARMGASAAYYIAAGSSAIVANKSAMVGSVGTIWTLMNFAGLLEKFGVKAKILTPEASDLKAAGNPYKEMTAKEEAYLQERVEQMNAQFTGFVSANRPVKADAMRGQWVSGAEGAENGLVDYVGGRARAVAELRALIG